MKIEWIVSGLVLIGTIGGGIYFMEDRYQKQEHALCQIQKNNQLIESSVNTLRIELLSQKLLDTPAIQQPVVMGDIKALQDRQNALAVTMSAVC